MRHYLLDSLELNKREKIKRWLSEFNTSIQAKFNSHFETDKANILDFQNELAVGHILKKAGFDIEYEADFDGQTPDFFVNHNSSHPPFIVEVRSLNTEKKLNTLESELEDLKESIRKLQYRVKLKIEFDHFVDDDLEILSINKEKILNNLKLWLDSNDKVDNFIIIDDIKLILLDLEEYSDYITLSSSSSIGYKFQEHRFIRAIKKKKEKYIKLIKKYDFPYVISIFNTFSSRIEPDQIEGIFLGKRISYIIPNSSSYPIYQRTQPKIQAKDIKYVSGILVFEYISNRWGIQYFDNSNFVKNKLPAGIFDKLLSLNNLHDDKIDDFLAGSYVKPTIDDLFR
jgi:uncharacterized protein YeeX (DUF496 family)